MDGEARVERVEFEVSASSKTPTQPPSTKPMKRAGRW